MTAGRADARADGATPRLELSGITKIYPSVVANENVDLTVMQGEIHAVLGENGAGKSTLMKMIYGVVKPDGGEMRWEGQPVVVANPAHARELGINMVFQHFSLFETLSVVENVALALPGRADLTALSRRITTVSEKYGLPVDPRRIVHSLSVGERQRVEIIRCLLQTPKLLIMDEPTSVLTPQAVRKLFETLRQLAAEGCSILYISHKLDEIQELCHTATVLRGGKVTGHCVPSQESPQVDGADDDRQGPAGLRARRGEGGRRGASQDRGTLARCRRSVRHRPPATCISTCTRARSSASPAFPATASRSSSTRSRAKRRSPSSSRCRSAASRPVARRRDAAAVPGSCFVPEERLGRGAVPTMSLAENAILTAARSRKFVRRSLIDFGRAREFAAECIEKYNVKCGGPQAQARSLSGGNLQKFIVGREILQEPKVLIVAQPTWGVDVGASAFIRQSIIDLRNARLRGARDLGGTGRAVRDLRPHRGDRQGSALAREARERDQRRGDRRLDERHVAGCGRRGEGAPCGSLRAGPKPSNAMRYASPAIAVTLTLVGGMLVFVALGRNPVEGFRIFFLNPVRDLNAITELLLKATPLMLIAVGLAVGFRANVWNIGAEGQFLMGAVAATGVALGFQNIGQRARAAGDGRRGRPRRRAVGGDPGAAQDAFQRERDPDLADARLHRAARAYRGSCSGPGRIRRASTFRRPRRSPTRRSCRS